MFERLKITAFFKTPVFLNHPPYLDGMIISAMEKFDAPDLYWNGKELGKNRDKNIPFIAKIGDVNACSFGKYKVLCEQIVRWRKRFDTKEATKYMKKNKKIYTTMGKYRNYDVPIKIQNIEKIEWIVLGKKKKIEKYLPYIMGIGKKNSQGYGIIDRWEVQKTEARGERHFPLEEKGAKNKMGNTVFYVRYKPSYHNKNNESHCVIRKF